MNMTAFGNNWNNNLSSYRNLNSWDGTQHAVAFAMGPNGSGVKVCRAWGNQNDMGTTTTTLSP